MHHRRPHRKSRRGCKRCKAKRMKCDEVHPLCGNCRDYNLECDFSFTSNGISTSSLPPVKIAQLRKPSPHSNTLPSKSHLSNLWNSQTRSDVNTPSAFVTKIQRESPKDGWENTTDKSWSHRAVSQIAISMNTPTDKLLENRLLHHYMLMSSETILRLMGSFNAIENQHQHIPQQWLMSLALSSSSLMDALLGLSAFNLRRLIPSNDKQISIASHKYMTGAISAHVKHLQQGITKDNAEVIFAESFTIASIAVGSHQYLCPDCNEDLPFHWFRPWQGVRTVMEDTCEYIRGEKIRSVLDQERVGHDQPGVQLKNTHRFNFLLDGLDKDKTDPGTMFAYKSSVDWLSITYDNPNLDFVFKFTGKVTPKFVEMLMENDPRTLAILGYFFMLLKTLQQVPWLPLPTEQHFRALMGRLPDEWKPRMQWAIEGFESGSLG